MLLKTRKLRSENEFSPYAVDMDFEAILDHGNVNAPIERRDDEPTAPFHPSMPLCESTSRTYSNRNAEKPLHVEIPEACEGFPCVTFNFGPQVRTFKHRDTMNLAGGWCAVSALRSSIV